MSAMYDQSTLGTANNLIIFNNYSAYPMFRVKHTTPSRREIREQDAPIPGEAGVADFDAEEGKSYFIIEGTMYASDESNYYQGRRQLRKVANLDIQQSDTLSDNGYVNYTWYEASAPRAIAVKVQYVDKMDETSNKGYSQPFALVCKVKNPIIINPIAVTTTLGVTGLGVITGSTAYPFGYPIGYGASTYTAGGSVNNEGDISAYPAFSVVGPVNVPRITNLTTGEYIEVNVNLATSSDVLAIAYDQDTAPVLTLNGTSVYDKKTTGSTFFKIKPGGNNLQLTGQSISGGVATVSFYSSWPLS